MQSGFLGKGVGPTPIARRGLSYLLRDQFLAPLAAGAVNGTNAAPGPGARTVVDTENHLSIGNRVACYETKSPSAWGNPGIWWTPQIARVPGTSMLSVVSVVDNVSTGTGLIAGFSTTTTGVPDSLAHFFYADGFIYVLPGSVKTQAYGLTTYQLLSVMNTAGGYLFARGGAMTSWTYLGKTATGSEALLYATVVNQESSFYLRTFAVFPPAALPVSMAYIAANEVAGDYSALHGLFAATGPYKICFDGDSLTAGVYVARAVTYPYLVMSALGDYTWYTTAMGGSTAAQMASRASALVDTLPGCEIVVAWAGVNEIATQTGAQIYATMRAYCEARRATGKKVVILTLLPRTDATQETNRTDYNVLVRANWEDFADGLADVAADSRIGDAGDQLDLTYYNADATHLTAAGYAVVAEIVVPIVDGLL